MAIFSYTCIGKDYTFALTSNINFMRVLNSELIAKNTPLRLTREEMEDPQELLRNFFSSFTLNDIREALWDVFSRSLATNDCELGCITHDCLVYYYEEMVRMVEAAGLIYGPKGRTN
jgi:hypothetical protein